MLPDALVLFLSAPCLVSQMVGVNAPSGAVAPRVVVMAEEGC